MSAADTVAVAITFVWLGMVLAISFLEAPLKFRAPGVTLRIGLGIGRLVFRALNAVECGLAVALAIARVDRPGDAATMVLALAILVLLAQVLAVRPALSRRTRAVLRGEDSGGSRVHLAYIALEVIKAALLLSGGILLLEGAS